jgi:hypothetical protein
LACRNLLLAPQLEVDKNQTYRASNAAARRRRNPAAIPTIVGVLIPASGRPPFVAVEVAVGLAVAVPVGEALALAVAVGVGETPPLAAPDPVGEAVAVALAVEVGEADPVARATGEPLADDSSVALSVNTNGSQANEPSAAPASSCACANFHEFNLAAAIPSRTESIAMLARDKYKTDCLRIKSIDQVVDDVIGLQLKRNLHPRG